MIVSKHRHYKNNIGMSVSTGHIAVQVDQETTGLFDHLAEAAQLVQLKYPTAELVSGGFQCPS